MSTATDEILDKLKSLTLLEASELVKQIEEAFGVSAAAPVGGMMMMGAGPAATAEPEEVKDLVEAAPKAVKEAIAKEAAEELKKQLEAVGAKIAIK